MKKKNRISFAILAALLLTACVVLSGCGAKMPYDGLNLDDYIKVGEYKGLTVDKDFDKATKEDIQAKIDQAIEQASTSTDLKKGDVVKNGDTVNIDFVGKLNGKEFDGGTAKGHELELGSNSFIDGFESGLVGRKVGDEVDLDLTFPKDYNSEELAGKDVVFEVKINSAKRKTKPKYDDEFVKSTTTYSSTAEYEKSLEKTIAEEKTASKKSELLSQVVETSEVKKYPEDVVKKYQEGLSKSVDYAAEQYGVDREQMIAQYGASDEKALQKLLKEDAESRIKQEMVIQYIADKEDLSYTNTEMKNEVDTGIQNLKAQGIDEEKYVELTGKTVAQEVHFNLLSDKVKDFIFDNAKIEKSGK